MAAGRLASASDPRSDLLERKLRAGKITQKEYDQLTELDKQVAELNQEVMSSQVATNKAAGNTEAAGVGVALPRFWPTSSGSLFSGSSEQQRAAGKSQQRRHPRSRSDICYPQEQATASRRSNSFDESDLHVELSSKASGHWAQHSRQTARTTNEIARSQFLSETEEQMNLETKNALTQLVQRFLHTDSAAYAAISSGSAAPAAPAAAGPCPGSSNSA